MRNALHFLTVFALFVSMNSEAQECTTRLGHTVAATATRIVVAGNSDQLPPSRIAEVLNHAMDQWNYAGCQSVGRVAYSWFQSSSVGAEALVRVYFDEGLGPRTQDGTLCGTFSFVNGVGEVHLYSDFETTAGAEYPCDLKEEAMTHELGHYLGLGHTPDTPACRNRGFIMSEVAIGGETVKPQECAAADANNETGWEAGEVGCNDNDWCDPDHCSPILIDFAGDLFQLSSPKDPVIFDIDGSGKAREIGWVSRNTDDGFLCLDLNQNGSIDSGAELFGTATRLANGDLAENGYQAMAEIDHLRGGGNQDGVLSIEDQRFSELCIWRDANRNGVSESGELISLIASGVREISVNYSTFPYLDLFGNTLLYHGTAVLEKDGVVRQVRTVDVFFAGSQE